MTFLSIRRILKAVLASLACFTYCDEVRVLTTIVILQFLVRQLFNKSFRNGFDALFILNHVLCVRVVLQAVLALASSTSYLVVFVLATFIVVQLLVGQLFNKRFRNRFNLLFLLLLCIRAILQTFVACLVFPTCRFIVGVLTTVVVTQLLVTQLFYNRFRNWCTA